MKVLGLLVVLACTLKASNGWEAIHAVNFNGNQHNDTQGISFDPIRVSESYSYPNTFKSVPAVDNVLYRTVYYGKKLNYTIPVTGSGHYLLLIKFLPWESYSATFDLTLNGVHPVRSNFTVYETSAGYSIAYDHYVYFSVCDNILQYKNQESVIYNDRIAINASNSKSWYTSFSALAVLKGDVGNFPVLSTAEIHSYEDINELADHACWDQFETTTPLTTSTRPPTTQTTSIRPPTTSSRPPTSPSTTSSRPPTSSPSIPPPVPTELPPRPSHPPSAVNVVNIFNTFFNHIVKNININYYGSGHQNRTVRKPEEETVPAEDNFENGNSREQEYY